ncbi:Zn-ribbon domain-containing OB-fold protein, partial [Zhongshania sp.]|uniref:Zn-ribbon domain-containing OB-fold protein n=1 Tax=Zhongshania sp. TaxID=1971902 RepID=UPI0035675F54
MSSRLMDKGIYRVRDGSVALLGSKDGNTGDVVFPAVVGAQSGEEGLVEISGVGRLWTYTVQRFKPKFPFDDGQPDAEFVPYVVGYVSFEESGIIVEGRIVNAAPD